MEEIDETEGVPDLLKNLPIRLKFIALYVNMAIFTFPILIISYLVMGQLSGATGQVVDQNMQLAEAVWEMKEILQQQHAGQPGAVPSATRWEEAFARCRTLMEGDAPGMQLLTELDSAYRDGYLSAAGQAANASADRADAQEAELRRELVVQAADAVLAHNTGAAAAIGVDGAQKARSFLWIYPLFILVYFIATYSIGRRLTKLIAFPLRDLTAAAGRIAVGDVEVDIRWDSRDEIGALADRLSVMVKAINEQAGALQEIAQGNYSVRMQVRSPQDVINQSISALLSKNNSLLSEVKAAAAKVADGSAQIAYGSQSLASGATQQAASVEQFTSTITEIAAQAQENTRVARDTLSDAEKAEQFMAAGMEAVTQMAEAMRAISSSTRSIAQVVRNIDDIAFQTSILALNASVEASKAGIHGIGFAVVATEVRGLASKSAEAARETAELIENVIRRIEEGNKVAYNTGGSMEEVIAITKKTAEEMRRLCEASERQSGSIAEITDEVMQISSVVQENSATAEQASAAAQQISLQSGALNALVAQFHLREEAEGMTMEAERPKLIPLPDNVIAPALATGTD